MAVTIYDIAKRVGTSAATVSLALQGRGRISDETREKVQSIADELGYQPNHLARSLVRGKTKTIGFVFNFSSSRLSHDATFVELFHSVSQIASDFGYKTFFHSSIAAKPVKEVLSEMASFGVDGIILGSSFNNTEDRQVIYESQMPVVALFRDIYARKVSGVLLDDVGGATMAVNHLLSLGHRRIAFAGKYGTHEAALRRFEGYQKALVAAGIEIDEKLIFASSLDMEDGKKIGLRVAEMPNRPTAIFAAGDLLAIGAITELRKSGFDVPRDISVAGFANVAIGQMVSPTLTTVGPNCDEYAKIVVDALMRILNDQDYGERIIVPVDLIVRESTGHVKN